MAKKKVTAGSVEQGSAAPAAHKATVIFVNSEKHQRAKDIVALCAGKVPKTESEADLKERFSAHFAEAEVSPKSAEALQWVYEKLGGLVRTEGEQEAHEEKVASMKKANKKRAIEK